MNLSMNQSIYLSNNQSICLSVCLPFTISYYIIVVMLHQVNRNIFHWCFQWVSLKVYHPNVFFLRNMTTNQWNSWHPTVRHTQICAWKTIFWPKNQGSVEQCWIMLRPLIGKESEAVPVLESSLQSLWLCIFFQVPVVKALDEGWRELHFDVVPHVMQSKKRTQCGCLFRHLVRILTAYHVLLITCPWCSIFPGDLFFLFVVFVMCLS